MITVDMSSGTLISFSLTNHFLLIAYLEALGHEGHSRIFKWTNKIFILYLFPLVRKNMQISYREYSWGYIGRWWKTFIWNTVSLQLLSPLPLSSPTVWTRWGEVTELWMYFPYWIWSNSAANVLYIQMRLFKQSWIENSDAIAMAEALSAGLCPFCLCP